MRKNYQTIPSALKLAERPNLVSEDGLDSDIGDIIPVELAEVVRLRGVKCPVSAGPGGFLINTVIAKMV